MTPEQQSLTSNDEVITALRDHAWDYFELHAEQRLKAFHFYILLETGLVAGLLLATRAGSPDIRMITVIGLLMAFFSIIFWKIDFRTKGMIKISEEALKLYEKRKFGNQNDDDLIHSTPFLNDPQVRGLVGRSPFGTLSYSKCFGAVFAVFALLGLVMSIGGAVNLLCH
ncbi:MAG TPA: hypothetical protein VF943_13980 [Burkholderiales bacterium]